jgi:hypothetical protein
MMRGATLEEKQRWMRERQSPAVSLSVVPKSSTTFGERHFTVAEVAAQLHLGPDAARKLFESEPGVLVIGERESRRGRRRYTTLRIPVSVAERVYRRLLNP